MPRKSPRLAVKQLDQLCHHTPLLTMSFHCFTTNGVVVLAFLFPTPCQAFVHMFVHVCIQAKNSNGTTVGTFSNFNLMHGCCMLLPFPSTIHHYALLTLHRCCDYYFQTRMNRPHPSEGLGGDVQVWQHSTWHRKWVTSYFLLFVTLCPTSHDHSRVWQSVTLTSWIQPYTSMVYTIACVQRCNIIIGTIQK